jgi:hypothetical protein
VRKKAGGLIIQRLIVEPNGRCAPIYCQRRKDKRVGQELSTLKEERNQGQ